LLGEKKDESSYCICNWFDVFETLFSPADAIHLIIPSHEQYLHISIPYAEHTHTSSIPFTYNQKNI